MFRRRRTLWEFQKRGFTANGRSAVVIRADESEYFDLRFFR